MAAFSSNPAPSLVDIFKDAAGAAGDYLKSAALGAVSTWAGDLEANASSGAGAALASGDRQALEARAQLGGSPFGSWGKTAAIAGVAVVAVVLIWRFRR